MTVASKLQALAAIKAAQYDAIIAKGGTLSPGDWSAYAAAIAALPSGGGAYNPDFPSPIFTFFPSDTFVNGDEPTSKAWYVRPGGAGDKDGRDWDNAFATREDAIEAAESGDHIRVMEGLYYIGTIQIPKYGVSEYYGFTQADGTWATRNPWLHPSKLDACFTSNRWQNDTVVFPLGQVVDGLYVQNVFGGRGITSMQAGKFRNVSAVNCDNTGSAGGGMYFVTCYVDGCFVTKCSGDRGGGVRLDNGSSLTNCAITNCSGDYGGGVYANNSSLNNCAITNCSASQHGGGAFINGGVVERCALTNNVSNGTNGYGGGIYMSGGTMRGCALSNNCTIQYAGHGGGAYAIASTILNCLFQNNMATHSAASGGGVYATYNSRCYNVTCAMNTAPTGDNFYLTNSQILYNCASWGGNIYLAQANYAYKIYGCASDNALTGVSGWDTNADVQNFLTLTDFPFAAPALPPWDEKGAFNYNLSKGEESLAYIKNTVLPSMLDAHLPAGSPLIGAGYYAAGVTPDTDADGKERPITPSIGAYEP